MGGKYEKVYSSSYIHGNGSQPLTACGSNAASTETTTAAASEAASEKETAGKEAENTEAAAKQTGSFRTVPVIHPVLRFHIPVPDSVIPGIILY